MLDKPCFVKWVQKKCGLGGRLGLDVFCVLPCKAVGVEGEVFINKGIDEKVAVAVAACMRKVSGGNYVSLPLVSGLAG